MDIKFDSYVNICIKHPTYVQNTVIVNETAVTSIGTSGSLS
jgi:hypothetical protein